MAGLGRREHLVHRDHSVLHLVAEKTDGLPGQTAGAWVVRDVDHLDGHYPERYQELVRDCHLSA